MCSHHCLTCDMRLALPHLLTTLCWIPHSFGRPVTGLCDIAGVCVRQTGFAQRIRLQLRAQYAGEVVTWLRTACHVHVERGWSSLG